MEKEHIAAVLAHAYGGLAPSLSFFLGVLAGAAYSPVETRLRAARSAWNPVVESQAAAGTLELRRWLARAMLAENAALAAYAAAWTGLAALLALLPGLARLYPGFRLFADALAGPQRAVFQVQDADL